MKRKLNLFLAALSMVALASCAKEIVDVDETAAQTETTFTFDLGADEGVDTKTAMINKKTCWVSGDQIAVTDGTTTEILTVPVQNTWNSVTTIRSNKTFEGTVYAVYPVDALKSVENGKLLVDIPAVQSGLFEDCNIMVGRNVNNGFSMKNATAVMKVDAYRDNLDITLIAPNSALSGEMYVELGEDGLISSEEMKSSTGAITVHAEKRGQYYVAVAPGTYASGFTAMGVSRESGLYESRTASASNTLAAGDIVKLGTIGTRLKGMEGSGSSYDPYTISNTAEWYLFAKSVNEGNDYEGEYVRLAESGVVATVPAGWYDATNEVDYYFKGTFYGGGNTITLALDAANAPGTSNVALFGDLGAGASIQSITVDGNVKGTGNYTAGVAAMVNGGLDGVTLSNCKNKATVSGTKYAGGLCGYADGTVVFDNCSNEGNITGTQYVGGYIGLNATDASFSRPTNTGDVTGTSCVGGIVGYQNTNALKINNGRNNNKVTGTTYVGGIVGYNAITGSVLESCTNAGDVTGTWDVGGIIGLCFSPTITSCQNIGTVTGTAANPGLYLINPSGVYKYMSPSASGSEYKLDEIIRGVGGIAGLARNSKLTSCINNGPVKGVSKVGGIYGTGYNANTSGCANINTVTGTGEMVGGIGGFVYTIVTSTGDKNGNNVSGTYAVGGLFGMMNLVGYSSSNAVSKITNPVNAANIKATGSSTFSSYNSGVSEVSAAGGIIGATFEICPKTNRRGYYLLNNALNEGFVTGAKDCVGGIIGIDFHGYNYATDNVMQKVINKGKVTARSKVGGIAGATYDRFCAQGGVAIRDAYNRGNIIAETYLGGILGTALYQSSESANFGTRIYNAHNKGTISPSNASALYPYVGGIAGCLNHGTIQNAFVYAQIEFDSSTAPEGAANYVGKIAGYVPATRSSAKWCYYTADEGETGFGASSAAASISQYTRYTGFELSEAITDINGTSSTDILAVLNAWSANWASYGYYTWTLSNGMPQFNASIY